MKLFPAVDILDGKAVRLLEGKIDSVTVYGDPLEMAHKWASKGAEFLHIVNLNAAFGQPNKNNEILKKIASEVNLIAELGGGMRNEESIRYALDELGFNRIIIGSSIVTSPKLVKDMARIYSNRIVAGLDARAGKLAIKGWQEDSTNTPLETAEWLKDFGITDIIYTDISRDGRLVGPNFDATKKLQQDSGMNVIASGGVSSLTDLVKLKKDGIYGAIIGKALYEDKIDLGEAIQECQPKE